MPAPRIKDSHLPWGASGALRCPRVAGERAKSRMRPVLTGDRLPAHCVKWGISGVQRTPVCTADPSC